LRSVIFDLDGTLADTSGDLIAAANACFAAEGLGTPLDAGRDAAAALRGGRAMLRLGFSRLGTAWTEADVDAAYPVLLEAYRGGIATHTRLYPGAMAAVEALLRDGIRVSVCTNKPEGLAELLLKALGVREAFGALVGADTFAVRKPDPLPYRAAVERAGGTVARSMLVGDTETDAKTGAAAGVPVVLVTFGPEGAGVERFGPTALLDRFEDLPAMAGRLLG
jgi:phosphoglycolate phosphatase